MSEWRLDAIGDDDANGGDAPICGACGVTALPSTDSSESVDAFACANDDCEAFGELVMS